MNMMVARETTGSQPVLASTVRRTSIGAMPADTAPTPTSLTFSNDLRLGLTADLVDQSAYDRAVERFKERKIALPTFAQVTDPTTAPAGTVASLEGVDPDAMDARNQIGRAHV